MANAWVGFDDNGKLGRGAAGGRAALPAWMDFMCEAHKDVPDIEPKMPREHRHGVRIDPNTGEKATGSTEGAIFEVFREGRRTGAATGDGGLWETGRSRARHRSFLPSTHP